jgi:hypothetical protein
MELFRHAGGLALAFVLVTPEAFAAPAQAVDTAPTSTCAIRGYLTDTDPNGTNVRSAPRVDAAAIGRLPQHAPHSRDSADAVAAEFDIIGSKNGWLLIRNARFENPDRPVVSVFDGPGWISGGMVGFTIGSNELRSAPAADAAIVAPLTGETPDGVYGPDSWQVVRVHSCSGHSAEVTIRRSASPTPKALRGWVGRVCSNQLTTCG